MCNSEHVKVYTCASYQWWNSLINRPPVCVWSLSLAVRNIGSLCYFIMERQFWQKPWHRNLSSKGSGDSLGIIRINAEMWNKEMSHHNTDQLFISVLFFTRWISWVIMDRQDCQTLRLMMTDIYALFPSCSRMDEHLNI